MRNRLYFTIICLCLIAWSFGLATSANGNANDVNSPVPLHWNPDFFMGSWEIRPGMKGIAKTVIFGTRIDEFDVTVIQVARGRGFDNRPMLLCRAEGWVVDLTGGIAGGMSGSPVYIDGKLAGAVSGHWSNTDQKTCIVTPIDQMLFSFEHSDDRFEQISLATPGSAFDVAPYILDFAYPHNEDKPSQIGGMSSPTGTQFAAEKFAGRNSPNEFFILDSPVEIGGEEISAFELARKPVTSTKETPGVLVMQPCLSPLTISSASDKLANAYADAIGISGEYDVSIGAPFAIGDMFAVPDSEFEAMRGIVPDSILEELRYPANVFAPAILEPGCVLGVRTVRGDLSSFGYGTLTYVDSNGNFLAYGHRSGRSGKVSMPVANGYVYYVSANWQRVGKNAVCLETVGTLYQDRGAAVAGTLGHKPSWIPVTVTAQDADTGETTVIRCEAADSIDLLPQAASGIVSAGLGYASGRSSEGTVTALFDIKLKNQNRFSWKTIYFADDSLGSGGAEVRAFLDAALRGEGEKVEIESVFADSQVSLRRTGYRVAEVRGLSALEFDKILIPKSGNIPVPAGQQFEESFPAVFAEKVTDDKLTLTHDRVGRVCLMIRLVPLKSNLDVWIPVKITIPRNLFGKKARLQIYGGAGLSNPAECGKIVSDTEKAAQRKHIAWKRSGETLSKLEWLAEFTHSPRGQHLIVEVVYAGKPEDAGLAGYVDLPHAARRFEPGGVISGYMAAEAVFK